MLVVELNGVQFGSIPLHYIRFGIVKTIVNISLFFLEKERSFGENVVKFFYGFFVFLSFFSSLVGCLEKALKFYWLFCFSVAFLLARKNI